MDVQQVNARMEEAFHAACPLQELGALAEALVAEGMSQPEMYRLFDRYRAMHQSNVDETCYDALLDTMDRIVGWGNRSWWLFEQEYRPER